MIPSIRTDQGDIGNDVWIKNPNLSSFEKTFLETDVSSSASALTVQSGLNFSVGEHIVVGQVGPENTELIRIHTSTTPTSTTITLNANLSFAHAVPTIIRFIPYNQIEVERSTDSGTSFSNVATIAIRVDATETYFNRPSDASTDLYRVRFRNSADSTVSDYSDSAIATGLADNTVYAIEKRALESVNMSFKDVDEESSLITRDWLHETLWEGRRELHNDKRVYRWSFRKKFNEDVGNVASGDFKFTLPTDLQDPETNKNILGFRIGTNLNMLNMEKTHYDEIWRNIPFTTLGAAITSTSDTSITLTNSRDFDESGAIDIPNGASIDNIDYTANNQGTGVISGVTNISVTHLNGANVFQNASFGLPTRFVVFGGDAYFDRPVDTEYDTMNYFMDYYTEVVVFNSNADVLDEPEYDMFVNYLAWRIKKKKNQGIIKIDDNDYVIWRKRVDDLVAKELADNTIEIVPQIDHLDHTGGF